MTRELTTISRGWPAILSLGWHADPRILPKRTGPLPEQIERFITSEVYEPAPHETKRLAASLLGIHAWDARLFIASFGEANGLGRLDSLIAHGFTSPVGDRPRDALELHPLIRTYIKNRPSRQEVDEYALASLTKHLVAAERWDEAWSTAGLSTNDSLMSSVMHSSFDSLLRSGRSGTLTKWLRAETPTNNSALSMLVRSEIALRRGDLAEAESFAAQASDSRQTNRWVRCRAHLVAGRSSHLSHRSVQALRHFQKARVNATCSELIDEAEWGRFLAQSVLASDDCDTQLIKLEETATRTEIGRLRFATATYFIGRANGDLRTSLDVSRITFPLVSLVNDPLTVTSFLHAYSTSLALSASYDESLHVSDIAITYARRFRIDFSLSHLLVTRAISLAGIRSYDAAADSLREALTSVKDQRALEFVETNVAATEARIALMNGDPELSLSLTTPRWDESLNSSMISEIEATRDLALLLIGSSAKSRELHNRAIKRSRTIETASLCLAIRACEATINASSQDDPEDLFTECRRIRGEDAFVVAFRALPDLCIRLGGSTTSSQGLNELQRRSHDVPVPTAPYRRTEKRSSELTTRENELGNLLITGLSNRQLAEQLHLSETTVKVHLRHIFKKLDASNRTEAVVKLLQMKQRAG